MNRDSARRGMCMWRALDTVHESCVLGAWRAWGTAQVPCDNTKVPYRAGANARWIKRMFVAFPGPVLLFK